LPCSFHIYSYLNHQQIKAVREKEPEEV